MRIYKITTFDCLYRDIHEVVSYHTRITRAQDICLTQLLEIEDSYQPPSGWIEKGQITERIQENSFSLHRNCDNMSFYSIVEEVLVRED